MKLYIPLILSFAPTFFFISITPGLNMLASMNISAAYGIVRVLPFILGAVFGIVFVAVLSAIGITSLMTHMAMIFDIIKYVGAAFLCYLGYKFLQDNGELSHDEDTSFARKGKKTLAANGFLTATLNPKAWLFFAAFLPAFLMEDMPLNVQIAIIVAIIMVIETSCMLIYALGGNLIGRLFTASSNIRVLNKINAAVMFGLAIILILK